MRRFPKTILSKLTNLPCLRGADRTVLQYFKLSCAAIAIGMLASACQPSTETEQATTKQVAVTVTDTGCDPGQLTVAPGKTTFVISNKSSKPLEWEILEGVIVVEERENIAPGFVQTLKADLKSGEYAMTCGLRSNPKGKIVVTATKSTALNLTNSH